MQIGLPEGSILFNPTSLAKGDRRIARTFIASPSEMREMLQVTIESDLRHCVEQRPMQDANQTDRLRLGSREIAVS